MKTIRLPTNPRLDAEIREDIRTGCAAFTGFLVGMVFGSISTLIWVVKTCPGLAEWL